MDRNNPLINNQLTAIKIIKKFVIKLKLRKYKKNESKQNKQLMGNRSEKVSSVDFKEKDWEITDRYASQNQFKGNYRVLQNTRTGQLIDEYQFIWPSQEDFRFYLDSYNWRRQQYNIVQSRFIVQQHNQQFCSKTYAAKIYIEHIPTRLSDVTDIPHPDNLYVVLTALEGYQKLYENVHHYFPLAQDQICVDKEGCVKVWVNSDLSKNYPQTDLCVNADHKDQSHMVQELLSIIWENTDEESQPLSFRQFFTKKKGKKRIGFDQAKVIINQYAKNISCQIPQKFISILQMNQQSQQYADTRNQNSNEDQGQLHDDAQNHQNQVNQNNEIHYQNAEGHADGYYQGGLGGKYRQGGQGGQYRQDEQGGKYRQGGQGGQYRQGGQNRQGAYNIDSQNSYNSNPMQHVGYDSHFYHNVIQGQYIGGMAAIQPINPQFIPKSTGPVTGPIITIPPSRGQFRLNEGNIGGGQLVHQAPGTKHPPLNLLNQHKKVQFPAHKQSHPNQGYSFQPFSNRSQQYQQRVSTLNTGENVSQQHRYSQQPNYHQQHQQNYDYEMVQNDNFPDHRLISNRQEITNSPVNRSLQLRKNSSKKISQTQNIRTIKSHINEPYHNMYGSGHKIIQNGINLNFASSNNATLSNTNLNNANFEQMHSYNNSRHTASGKHDQNKRNQQQNGQMKNSMLDTKYYTLDTQVQLDEEIAADLKKFILAS